METPSSAVNTKYEEGGNAQIKLEHANAPTKIPDDTLSAQAGKIGQADNVAVSLDNPSITKVTTALKMHQEMAQDPNVPLVDRTIAAVHVPIDKIKELVGVEDNLTHSYYVVKHGEDNALAAQKDAATAKTTLKVHKNIAADSNETLTERAKAVAQIPVDKVREVLAERKIDTPAPSAAVAIDERGQIIQDTEGNIVLDRSGAQEPRIDTTGFLSTKQQELEANKSLATDSDVPIIERAKAAANVGMEKVKGLVSHNSEEANKENDVSTSTTTTKSSWEKVTASPISTAVDMSDDEQTNDTTTNDESRPSIVEIAKSAAHDGVEKVKEWIGVSGSDETDKIVNENKKTTTTTSSWEKEVASPVSTAVDVDDKKKDSHQGFFSGKSSDTSGSGIWGLSSTPTYDEVQTADKDAELAREELENHKQILSDSTAPIIDRVIAAVHVPIDKASEWAATHKYEELEKKYETNMSTPGLEPYI